MKKSVTINKNVGETPLTALNAWKSAHSTYANITASYAGRLDPMASGKLLILLGEECKQQKKYTSLDKEYEVEVLLDAGSDTGDALGLVTYSHKQTGVISDHIRAVLRSELGIHVRSYPNFSSKTVHGKPLFLHTLEGTIGDVDIPQHEEQIYKIKQCGVHTISAESLQSRIAAFLAQVPTSDQPSKQLGADFRVVDVQKSWELLFKEAGERMFTILTLRIACGSGTYMRSLAGRIGEGLGTHALALSIDRTKIGKYWHGLWLSTF